MSTVLCYFVDYVYVMRGCNKLSELDLEKDGWRLLREMEEEVEKLEFVFGQF